jgi:hypothetical protein
MYVFCTFGLFCRYTRYTAYWIGYNGRPVVHDYSPCAHPYNISSLLWRRNNLTLRETATTFIYDRDKKGAPRLVWSCLNYINP